MNKGNTLQEEEELLTSAPDDMTYEEYLRNKPKHIILNSATIPENIETSQQSTNQSEQKPSTHKEKGKRLLKKLFKRSEQSFNNTKLIKGNLHASNHRATMNFMEFTSECQILRSAGHWSIGLKANQTENSIQLAYIDLISNA